jgi:hypothetical protein
MFDPKVGRWTTQDPLGFSAGDANLYRYVGNATVNAADPSGLASDPPFLGSRAQQPSVGVNANQPEPSRLAGTILYQNRDWGLLGMIMDPSLGRRRLFRSPNGWIFPTEIGGSAARTSSLAGGSVGGFYASGVQSRTDYMPTPIGYNKGVGWSDIQSMLIGGRGGERGGQGAQGTVMPLLKPPRLPIWEIPPPGISPTIPLPGFHGALGTGGIGPILPPRARMPDE